MDGATTSCSNESSVPIFPSEDELIVAQILLDLRPMMSLIDSLADSNWKRKRRRSFLNHVPPLLSIQRSQNEIKGVQAAATEEDGGGDDRTTTSPDSPFVFPQSDESDEKFKHSSKMTRAKRSKKNQLDMIQQLTQQKGFLQGEIEKVKNYCKELQAYNSQLKTIKQQIRVGINCEIALTQNPIGPMPAHSNNGLNRVGPIGFDLNVPAEEAFDELQPLDVDRVNGDERARCAAELET